MLRDLAPKASIVAMLVNPISPNSASEIKSVRGAARSLGWELAMFNASTPSEIKAAFAAIAERKPDAFLVASDPFESANGHRSRAARLRVPAIYPFRDFAAAGGLISYGTNI